MNRIVLLFVLLGISFLTKAQQQVENKDTIYISEKMPQFPGGDDAFYTYLDKNVHLPDGFDAAAYLVENGNQFVPISVAFTINVDGSIINAHVIEKVNEMLDNKAVEIIKNMPKWEPGFKNGKSIKVQYAIPVRFNLKG